MPMHSLPDIDGLKDLPNKVIILHFLHKRQLVLVSLKSFLSLNRVWGFIKLDYTWQDKR